MLKALSDALLPLYLRFALTPNELQAVRDASTGEVQGWRAADGTWVPLPSGFPQTP